MEYCNKKKLNTLQLDEENMYVAIDFDRTITSKESVDSWDASGNLLGEKFRKELSELYEKYGPIEQSYTISFEEKEKAMEEWYAQCMELYEKYQLTKSLLTDSIQKSNLIFREGAKEFLQDMCREEIPVIILSAGIGNVIEQFLKENHYYFDNMYIISNFIEFQKDGTMKKFNQDLMIHTLNKNMKGRLTKEWEKKLHNRRYRLLIGDLIEDKNMIPEKDWENTITVAFLNSNLEENRPVFQENFDIVLTRSRG